jgi:hypothetical protein
VEEALSRHKDDVLFQMTLSDRFQRIEETIQEMEWWSCFQTQDSPSHATLSDIPFSTGIPVVQTATKKSTVNRCQPIGIPDELFFAIKPMLAISGGRLLALSAPFGKRGWFYHVWP